MKKVEIFDPAMCCPTGVCGPSVDPELTRVASAVYSLEKKGFAIRRFQLTTDPDKFAENKKVNQILVEKGPDALPVVLVDDEVAKVGKYPSNEEFAQWFGISSDQLNEKPVAKQRINLE